MRGAYGVTAHLLHYAYLTAYSSLVHRSTQWAEVVVVAYALELRGLAIYEHALVGDDFERADAKACRVLVLKLRASVNL